MRKWPLKSIQAHLRCLHNGLRTHAATLGSKVDALPGALGHIASSITDQANAALAAPDQHKQHTCLSRQSQASMPFQDEERLCQEILRDLPFGTQFS